jgi:hypothetical protein
VGIESGHSKIKQMRKKDIKKDKMNHKKEKEGKENPD